MEINKILSADLLDLVFDDRNKSYGAYELRRNYPQRIKKSMIITFTLVFLAIGGAVLAKSIKPRVTEGERIIVKPFDIKPLDDEPEKVEPEKKQPDRTPTQTEQLTPPIIKPDIVVDNPLPEQDDIKLAEINDFKRDGGIDSGISDLPAEPLDGKRGILENKRGVEEPEPLRTVQVEARYAGNWEKFLLRNLNGNVPVDNGAPPGRHTVIVQFIVDKEGNVSDIQALSNVGFGMEQEAIRVLKRAEKWEPAIQAGFKVKAYRVQRITFEVLDQ